MLKAMFGDTKDIGLDSDKVKINIDGQPQTLPFPVAFRRVWAQTYSVTGSFLRLFLFDSLTDWCLTLSERRTKFNQTVIKDYLMNRWEQHSVWRKSNPISSENSMIYYADLLMLDKKRYGEPEQVADELIATFFNLAQNMSSTTTQLFYQLIRNNECKEKVIKELRANFCKVPEIEGIEQPKDAPELTASLIMQELDHENSNLLWQERSLMEAMRLDPPNHMSQVHITTGDAKMSNGERIPRGTRFQINLFAINRDVTQYRQPDEFIPERYSRKSEIYMTPGDQQRHPLSLCPSTPGQSYDQQFTFMVAKTVTSMFLAAMPEIEFTSENLQKQKEMPSSTINSPISV